MFWNGGCINGLTILQCFGVYPLHQVFTLHSSFFIEFLLTHHSPQPPFVLVTLSPTLFTHHVRCHHPLSMLLANWASKSESKDIIFNHHHIYYFSSSTLGLIHYPQPWPSDHLPLHLTHPHMNFSRNHSPPSL